MTGTVVHLDGYRRKHAQTEAQSACCCHATYVCYPHRIAEAARILRVDLAAAQDDGRISMARFVGTVEAVLPLLDAIVTETLPFDAEVQ